MKFKIVRKNFGSFGRFLLLRGLKKHRMNDCDLIFTILTFHRMNLSIMNGNEPCINCGLTNKNYRSWRYSTSICQKSMVRKVAAKCSMQELNAWRHQTSKISRCKFSICILFESLPDLQNNVKKRAKQSEGGRKKAIPLQII